MCICTKQGHCWLRINMGVDIYIGLKVAYYWDVQKITRKSNFIDGNDDVERQVEVQDSLGMILPLPLLLRLKLFLSSVVPLKECLFDHFRRIQILPRETPKYSSWLELIFVSARELRALGVSSSCLYASRAERCELESTAGKHQLTDANQN